LIGDSAGKETSRERLKRRRNASRRGKLEDLAERDYLTDPSILVDPHAYFEAVRAHGPIHTLANGIVVVTGFDEGLKVLRNSRDFSSVITSLGPAAPLPFTPAGPDITGQIEAHRRDILTGELISSLDDGDHAKLRGLLTHLFTPKRLHANEAFIQTFADELAREAVQRGGCELIGEIATPFVTMVIADLLGVPVEDRQLFMETLRDGPQSGSIDSEEIKSTGSAMNSLGVYFRDYVKDRRANPRDDVLSELSHANFPDGSLPDVEDIVSVTTFLFAAGQDTTAKLLGNAMRVIVGVPGLQEELRRDSALIPALIEEVLRLDGPIKIGTRLARRNTRIGNLALPAGTRVMVSLAAANRDPRRWDDPNTLVLDRPKAKEQLAFSRGAHVCIGAPLARTEARIMLEKFLEHTSRIEIDPEKHPKGEQDLRYEPSFIIRGLAEMHLKLVPR
jgi:cytochrome P450